MSYCIIKLIKNSNGVEMPVVLLNNDDEVLEFDNPDDAIMMAEIFTKNSDSGYKYYVKKL
jgi:hypothetical protein